MHPHHLRIIDFWLTDAQFSNAAESSATSPNASPPRRPSERMRQSMLKTLPSDPNMITPAISATLPAFQLVEDRERTPDPTDSKAGATDGSVPGAYLNLEDSDEEEAGARQYILAPRTYTPVPSPKLPSAQFQESISPPEENQGSPLRKRLSIKRSQGSPEAVEALNDDDGYWGPRRPLFSVSENVERQRANSASIRNERSIAPITVPTPQELEAITTPPSRGIDSAYCSDPKRPSPHGWASIPALFRTPVPTPLA